MKKMKRVDSDGVDDDNGTGESHRHRQSINRFIPLVFQAVSPRADLY